MQEGQGEQKKVGLLIGKFFCQFVSNDNLDGQNKLKVQIKAFDQKKKIQQLKKKKLYVVSKLKQHSQERLVCKVRKGKEIINKVYNNHGQISHLYDEIWFFLLNAGYVKLRVKIVDFKDPRLQIAEISVYLTQFAVDDNYELKIDRYDKKGEEGNNLEENQLEFLKYARLSLLLMFDFMNVSIEASCLIKQSKQFKIFFAQYCQFFQKSKNNFLVRNLLKSYHRPIIDIKQQQEFESYLNSKRFNNNLFEKRMIQDLVLYQTGPQSFVSLYKKVYSPKLEEIHPINHVLFQKISLEFFELVKNFIKRSKSSVDNQFQDFYDDYILMSVFLCTYDINEKILKDSLYSNQHKNLIKVRKLMTDALSKFNQKALLLLSDSNQKIYNFSKNVINDLYFIDFKVSRKQNQYNHYFDYRYYYANSIQSAYTEMERYIQRQSFQEIKGQIQTQIQNFNSEKSKQDINDIFIVNNQRLKEYETPKLMISELKKHQKEALYWMLHREGQLQDNELQQKQLLSPLWQEYKLQSGESLFVNMFTGKLSKELVALQETKGGILADEMGLGKTLMALALILETLKSEHQTLIVVPKSVLQQWEKEIIKHSKPDSLKVLVYYKNNIRKSKQIDLKNYNIILTTYAILSMDFSVWCQINNTNIGQDLEANESDCIVQGFQDSEQQNSDFSSSLDMYNSSSDEDDISQYSPYFNPLYQYLNEKRKKESQMKQLYKQQLKKEKLEKQRLKKQLTPEQLEKAKKQLNLFKHKYHRVILDEAHNIKARQTLQSKSANALDADYRWCLTGTPMQNKHDDLFSLLQFLKVETFSEYFWWNTYINKEENEEDQQRILSQILQPIVLRRTKNSQKFDGLNQVQEEICWVELNEKEKILYQKLLIGSQDIFKHFTIDKNNKSYVHIFQIINKLKLACNHPQLALKEINLDKTPMEEVIDKINQFFKFKQQSTNMTEVYKKSLIENIKNGDIQECEICTNAQIDTFCLSSCGHVFCRNCFTQIINQNSLCPICRTNLTIADLIEIKVDNEIEFEEFKTLKFGLSSKLESILNKTKIVQELKEKVLVFTQSIDMLQLIQNLYQDNGIVAYKITGQMSVEKREQVIKQFKESQDAIALLLSLKATSTGLNLTMANNVFLVDPWWNPAIEDQAIGRADRIGQQNQVKVVRFLCRNTIEQQINLLHQKKKYQIRRTFNGDAKKTQDLQDFKFVLFQQ